MIFSAKNLRVPLLFLPLAFPVLGTSPSPVIQLNYGSFQGITDGNVTSYLGIPYAAPPYVCCLSVSVDFIYTVLFALSYTLKPLTVS